MTTAHVKRHNGTPTLFLDGAPVFASMQWLSAGLDAQGDHPNDYAIREFAAAGVHLNAVMPPDVWCGPRPGNADHFDFSVLGAQLRAIVAADPQTRCFICASSPRPRRGGMGCTPRSVK